MANNGIIFGFGRGGRGRRPGAGAASEIVVNTDEAKTTAGTVIPSMTITLKPVDRSNGKATKFLGTDTGLGNIADFSGYISGEFDGKMAGADFQE